MKGKVIAQIDKDLLKEMEKVRDETGLPISRLLDLKSKGYKIIKVWLNMNNLLIEGFIRKVSKEEANKIEQHFKETRKLSLLCEYGAITFDESEYVIEYCENEDIYFATINMLVRGKDGLFIELKHDVNEAIDTDKIPCFNDIFVVKEL